MKKKEKKEKNNKMSTRYSKKCKIVNNNICLGCKKDIGDTKNTRCYGCQLHKNCRDEYWNNSKKRNIPIKCIKCNNFVMPEDREFCFNCYFDDKNDN
jgi:hypothetical protein